MTVKSISSMDKALIVHHYHHGDFNKQELAIKFGTSPRTIHRVLVEMGIETANEKYASDLQAYMRIINNYDVDPHQLDTILFKDSVSKVNSEDVQDYLNQCTKKEIAIFLYNRLVFKILPAPTQPKPLLTYSQESLSAKSFD